MKNPCEKDIAEMVKPGGEAKRMRDEDASKKAPPSRTLADEFKPPHPITLAPYRLSLAALRHLTPHDSEACDWPLLPRDLELLWEGVDLTSVQSGE